MDPHMQAFVYQTSPPQLREVPKGETGKNVVVLKRSDVITRNEMVFMPNTIEMAQLKKPEKGQFKTNVQFSSKMSDKDVKRVLEEIFPFLGNKRFFCAAAVDNRTRLDFKGEPRIWDGHFIKKKLKGNSALYILADEETHQDPAINVLRVASPPTFGHTMSGGTSMVPERIVSDQSLGFTSAKGTSIASDQQNMVMCPLANGPAANGPTDARQPAGLPLTTHGMPEVMVASMTNNMDISSAVSPQSQKPDVCSQKTDQSIILHTCTTGSGEVPQFSLLSSSSSSSSSLSSSSLSSLPAAAALGGRRFLVAEVSEPSATITENSNPAGTYSLHQISGQTDTASVPLENNQALLNQAIAPQVLGLSCTVMEVDENQGVFAGYPHTGNPTRFRVTSDQEPASQYHVSTASTSGFHPVFFSKENGMVPSQHQGFSLIPSSTDITDVDVTVLGDQTEMSDSNSGSDEGNSSVGVSTTSGIISDSDAYWSEEVQLPDEVDIVPNRVPLEGGKICCFNFKPHLPLWMRSGNAHFGNLGNVQLDIFQNESLIGKWIPPSPEPGWVEVTVESETGVPLGSTWINYYDDCAVHEPGECVQRVLDSEELQKSFFEKYAGKLCGNTSSGDTENSRNLGSSQPVQELKSLVYTAAETGAQQVLEMLFTTSAGRIAFDAYKDSLRLPEVVARNCGHEETARYLEDITARFSKEATAVGGEAVQKQFSLVSEEENDDLRTDETSDTDYFGDVETSSSGSSEPPASDSEDDISEVFSKGGDKVDLPYADASDGQVTSTEATPCKDDSECDQEENASRVSEPIPGYHCLSKCSRLLEYRESEREWNPRPSRGLSDTSSFSSSEASVNSGLDSEEHENRQLTNGDISDMDIFADVKTSSCDSSRPPTSNSVEASSEIFDKGGDIVLLSSFTDLTDSQVTSTEATPSKDDSEYEGEGNLRPIRATVSTLIVRIHFGSQTVVTDRKKPLVFVPNPHDDEGVNVSSSSLCSLEASRTDNGAPDNRVLEIFEEFLNWCETDRQVKRKQVVVWKVAIVMQQYKDKIIEELNALYRPQEVFDGAKLLRTHFMELQPVNGKQVLDSLRRIHCVIFIPGLRESNHREKPKKLEETFTEQLKTQQSPNRCNNLSRASTHSAHSAESQQSLQIIEDQKQTFDQLLQELYQGAKNAYLRMMLFMQEPIQEEVVKEEEAVKSVQLRMIQELFQQEMVKSAQLRAHCIELDLDYMKKEKKHLFQHGIDLSSDIAQGLVYLRNRSPSLVHTDLKTGNLLLTRQGSFYITKVGDLGTTIPQCTNLAPNRSTFGYVAPEANTTDLKSTKLSSSDDGTSGITLDGGSVEDVGQIQEALMALYVISKVLSVVELHSQGIVHRDVKGASILIVETEQQVKLVDFGTSVWLSNGYQQDDIPRGREPFMAPEVCRSHTRLFSADIWSLACILYQMLKGAPPLEQFHHCHKNAFLYQIGATSQPQPSPLCSPEVEDPFSQEFQLEPAKRPSARKLLNRYCHLNLFSADDGPIQLWQFLLGLIIDPAYSQLIKWTHDEDYEFKILQPSTVAKMWGKRKNRPTMNSQKLSRNLRYYHGKNDIEKVHGKRYVYQFMCDIPKILGYDLMVKNEEFLVEAVCGEPVMSTEVDDLRKFLTEVEDREWTHPFGV